MFYFRVNRIKIHDNRSERMHLGLFGPDQTDVQLISFVTTADQALPDLGEYQAAPVDRQKVLLGSYLEHVVGSRLLTPVQNVKDGHILTFGDTGYVLHRADRIPQDFSWVLLAVKSGPERSQDEVLERAVEHPGFDLLRDRVAQILRQAAPAFHVAVEVGRFLASILAGDPEDGRQLGLLYMTLNRQEHYPHGERNRQEVADLTGNLLVDYSMFGLDEPARPGGASGGSRVTLEYFGPVDELTLRSRNGVALPAGHPQRVVGPLPVSVDLRPDGTETVGVYAFQGVNRPVEFGTALAQLLSALGDRTRSPDELQPELDLVQRLRRMMN